jgi:hypothetical protein
MKISVFSGRILKSVFDEYKAAKDDYGFTRTHVPVFLARYGDENLVSRSQAKRLVSRLDRFSEIVLDFAGVETVGQAFADEIFRVFQQEHPGAHLTWVNAKPEVDEMILRAKSHDEGPSR